LVPNYPLRGNGPPGSQMLPTTVNTNSQGRATFDVLLPRNLGPFGFDVRGADGGGKVTRVSLSVVAPDAGTVFTLLDRDRTTGDDGDGGPAALAHVYNLFGVAAASDGTVYVGDGTNCRIRKVTPAGVLINFAGNGCGNSGNGGPALSAKLQSPYGLALDEPRGRLYFTDSVNNNVRVIDLDAGTIDLVAGGGTATNPGWGDNGPMQNAVFSQATWLTFHNEGSAGALYVTDVNHSRIRRIDLGGQRIDNFLATGQSAALNLWSCAMPGCALAFDAQGNAYVSSNIYVPGSGAFGGVLRVAAGDGGLSLIAGHVGSAYFGEYLSALQESFTQPAGITVDQQGNLFVVDQSANACAVRMIEAGTSRLHTVAGTGVNQWGADFVPASTSALNVPYGVTTDPAGHLYVVESPGSVRQVWGAANQPRVPASLDASVPLTQTTFIYQSAPMPLQVQLVDGVGQRLAGYPMTWSALAPGSYAYAPSTITDTFGSSVSLARAGLLPGSYQYQASFADALGNTARGSPVTFTVNAVVPDAGTLFTLANLDHTVPVLNVTGVPGVASLARLDGPYAVAVASDGTTYVAERGGNRVRVIRPNGAIEHLAGDPAGAAGYAGDSGPAAASKLSYPSGLAIDEVNGFLYIADTSNNVVRRVNLNVSPPRIEAFAGVGNSTSISDQGAPPAALGLGSPSVLRVRSETDSLGQPLQVVYVADVAHNRILRMPTNGAASSVLFDSTKAPTTGLTLLSPNNLCYSTPICSFDFDRTGKLHFTSYIQGTATTGGFGIVAYTPGVPGGAAPSFTLRVGAHVTPGASNADGVDATLINFGLLDTPQFTFDAANQLVFTDPVTHRVRRVDAQNLVTTIAGDGTPGYSGDLVPSALGRLNVPRAISFTNGHLYVVDTGNQAVRIIW
jgi:sugar lactone lactonase YvrE